MLQTRVLRSLGAVLLFLAATGIERRAGVSAAQNVPAGRVVLPFDAGWRFTHADVGNAAMPALDDSTWRAVDVPHDWSAEGPFSAEFGSGNGYAPGGIGWYRKHFTLDAGLHGKIVTIEFDGVYDHAEVWINGHQVCGRPYGYSTFDCPATPYAKFGAADNVVAVRVDHSRFADSRWYTGSGIYRHVRLRVTDAVRIARFGTFVTTPTVSADAAVARIETTIANDTDEGRMFTLHSAIRLGANVVASDDLVSSVAPHSRHTETQTLTITKPSRWAVDSPTLYTLHQRLEPFQSSGFLDEVDTSFGVRSTRFDPQRGFFLNDVPTKLKGVCVHQDAGSLGVAVPEAVWESRLRALKAIGVNAIRTSHNPPAPEFLDVCDRLGLLVKDEAFDEFTPAKNKWVAGWNAGVPSRFGYAESFEQWSVIDAGDMVRRDRNHPSVVMWSIGNEVDYPNDPFSDPVLGRSYRPENPPATNLVTLARPLVEAVHALDPTRPVTMALASVQMSDAVNLPAMLDVVGYNYQESRYTADHERYPARVIFGSENSHTYANWAVVRDSPYVAGQFLWTGIDYLGEARAFPNRANGAGVLDLAGFKKPAAWFRQSLWSDAPMVYIAASPASSTAAAGATQPRPVPRLEEHWNWPAGSTVTVSAYSNAEDVTLSLNDRPIGAQPMGKAVDGVLRWDVPYQPGVLKAVARNKGQPVAEFALATAGPAARVELVSLPPTTAVRDRAIAQIEYRVVDRDGIRVADANTEITFAIDGPARVLGIGNGDLNDVTPGHALSHRAYQGRGLAILEITGTGVVTIRAAAPGLQGATLALKAP